MSSRSYLSIGDVLTLLRQEFPDVTISKIRFLESQGLVNPERTPSGYRKFYEHDVERLRWVLRQQREHFLPLKVIKDRLDDDRVDGGVPDGPPPLGIHAGRDRRCRRRRRPRTTERQDREDEPALVGQAGGRRGRVEPVPATGRGCEPTSEEPVLVGQRASVRASVGEGRVRSRRGRPVGSPEAHVPGSRPRFNAAPGCRRPGSAPATPRAGTGPMARRAGCGGTANGRTEPPLG